MGSYALSAATRIALQQYTQQIATLNGAENFATTIGVQPARQQTLIERYQQQTDFLKRINIVQVQQATGDKLGLGSDKRVASNTDTRIQPRRPTPIGNIEHIDDYFCTNTDYDVAYEWAVIDNWSAFPDFQKRLQNLAIKLVAQDKQMIGFNGTHRAKTTNKTLYPKLQDVNVGWLEKIRAFAPERHIDSLTIGASHEFKNIDALVEMAVNDLIAEQFRDNSDLVVITSRGLVTDKYQNLINQTLAPTEQAAANALYQKKQLGTLPVDTPAYFPANGLLITSHDNLSIYQQRGSMRRLIKDEPEWNRTSDYQSVNESFVVEDYDKCAFIENLVIEA